VSEYEEQTGIDSIMDVDNRLDSESRLFQEGFTVESVDDMKSNDEF